jgi:hypothetical protein
MGTIGRQMTTLVSLRRLVLMKWLVLLKQLLHLRWKW